MARFIAISASFGMSRLYYDPQARRKNLADGDLSCMRVAPFADDPNSDRSGSGVAQRLIWTISSAEISAKYVHTSKKWFRRHIISCRQN